MVPSTDRGGYIALSATATNNEWAFIPASSVLTDHKAYRAKLTLYNALEKAAAVGAEKYAMQIATAAAVYNDASSSNAQLIAAAKTLGEAVSGDISSEAPMDVSYYITNAGFEELAVTGWNTTGITGTYNYGIYEMYGASFSIAQTLTVPNGYYTLTAQAYYRPSDAGSSTYNVYLKANNKQTRLCSIYDSEQKTKYSENNNTSGFKNGYPNDMYSANIAFALDAYTGNSVSCLVTDNTLTIGISSSETVQNWTVFDNFELSYCNDATGILHEDLDVLVTQASAIAQSDVPDAVYNTIRADIVTANAATTVAELNSSITNVTNDIALANSVSGKYKETLALIALCTSLQNHSTPNAAGDLATFAQAVTTASSGVESCATLAALTSLYNTLNSALILYCEASNPTEGYPVDFTFRMTNPSFESGSFTGWTNTISNSNINVGSYSFEGVEGSKAAPVWTLFSTMNNNATAVAVTTNASFSVTTGTFLLSPDCISSEVGYSVSFYGAGGTNIKLVGLSNGDSATLVGTSTSITQTASQVDGDYQISFASLLPGTYTLIYGTTSMKLVLYVYNN